MPYIDVNDLGDLDDIHTFIRGRGKLPRHMTRSRKAEDLKKAIDSAGTLAAMIDAEMAIDPYGRSSSYLLTGPQRISSAEAKFIEWILEKDDTFYGAGTLEEALRAFNGDA